MTFLCSNQSPNGHYIPGQTGVLCTVYFVPYIAGHLCLYLVVLFNWDFVNSRKVFLYYTYLVERIWCADG